jgi:CubicO group peptidase (beta-lactamase class C family)
MHRTARLLAGGLAVTGMVWTAAAGETRAQGVPFGEAVAAAERLPRLRSLLVSRDGELVLERYFNGASAGRPANIKSASKSVISTLVGIAIDRGLLPGADTLIAEYFPDLMGDADPRRAITIEDLLTMRSGLQSTSNRFYGAWVVSGDWVRHALTRPMLGPPGSAYRYSTGNTHLLSAILTRASGESTWAFADEALARPLGFSLARWPTDPQGIYFGGNDMLMTPHQMVAYGELYRNGGAVGGQQVVPREWIERSLVPRTRSTFSDQGYGYGWWTRDLAGVRAHFAWGFGGQYVFVVPDLDLVVVTTSSPDVGETRRGHRQTVMEIVEELIVAPLR